MGVIVRTAGVGRTADDLRRDLDYLKSAWESFSRRLKGGHGPAPLYQESDIAIRTVRDLFTSDTEAVIVDDPEVHRQILEFTRRLMPEAEDRVKLHDAAKPLFQTYGIEPDFERLFARRIELPSGGSIVFDQAEALVAIDVNSGRTRGGGHDFEDVALKTKHRGGARDRASDPVARPRRDPGRRLHRHDEAGEHPEGREGLQGPASTWTARGARSGGSASSACSS
jgi:ribonuclease E